MKKSIAFCLAGLFLGCCAAPASADWSWQKPLPQGNPLEAVWGTTSSDVFAVGGAGTILHYDGTSWAAQNSGTSNHLYGVWGTTSSDVFAVGVSGTILHYDGTSWTAQNSGTWKELRGVWGTTSSDVFAVGQWGKILHYDGTSWTAQGSYTSDDLRGVWGTTSSDVFAVGYVGTILHYDGTSWAVQSSGTSNRLYSVWGTTSSDVFAAGVSGTIQHYDGTSWTPQSSGTSNRLYGVWGTTSSKVFAVGYSGMILYYDGTSWTAQNSGTSNHLYGVWGTTRSDVFAVGDAGTILHYDGTGWISQSSGSTKGLYSVWGTTSSDVFAVGAAGTILHYDGTSWTAQNSGTTNGLLGVWGTTSSDVFAVGGAGTILHYDGTSWTAQNSGTSNRLYGVWGTTSSDVYVGGEYLTLLHYDGTNWSAQNPGPWSGLRAGWGTMSSDVFAVGGAGTILHYDGMSWTAQAAETPNTLWGIWGTTSRDVFAVGDRETILHYDGANWTVQRSIPLDWLRGVWGTTSSDVFAVGQLGKILHYDGTNWTAQNSGTSNDLYGVWGSGSDDVFAVGSGGTILHYTSPTEPIDCTPVRVVAAASDTGAGNSLWATDLAINNRGNEVLSYKFQFLPRGEDNSAVEYTEGFRLDPNTNASFTDIWQLHTGGAGAGSINVCVSDPAAAGVVSRTYNTNEDGTFGQTIVGKATSIGPNKRVRLGFLSENGAFRSNIGFMNASGKPITINVEFFTGDGTDLGTQSITLAPFSNDQWNRAFRKVTTDVVDLGYADVWTATDEGRFLTYGSVVDNTTSDPTTIWPFDTSVIVGDSGFDCTPIWVAAAASTAGANNTHWATDLALNNLGDGTLYYRFQFLPRGESNSERAMSDPYTLAAGAGVVYRDVWMISGAPGAGAINVCVDNGDLAGVITRTYNSSDTGTFGQTIVGFRGASPSKDGTNEKVRLGYLFENEAYRTNIGFMNAVADPITVHAEFFTMQGELLGIQDVELASYSNDQINRPYKEYGTDINAGFADVWSDTPGAEFLAYASVVDNGSGDATTIWPF